MPRLYEGPETSDILFDLLILLHLLRVGSGGSGWVGRHWDVWLIWLLRLRVRSNAIFAEQHRVEVLADAIFDAFEVCLLHAGVGRSEHFVVLVRQIEHQILHECALVFTALVNDRIMRGRVDICVDKPECENHSQLG